VNAPTIQIDTIDDNVTSAPVQTTETGSPPPHPLARASSCPQQRSGDISSVVNRREPEPKLKSIIKKRYTNGSTYTQSEDDAGNTVAAAGDNAQTSDYTKQTSVSSKSSATSERKGIHGRGCCSIC